MGCKFKTGVKMEPVYDIVIVGLGPASLSLAVALYEQPKRPKVLILDHEAGFSWNGDTASSHASHMKTSILQDLVTTRNPLSDFTFVNYLWSTGNLVDYTNLSLINPPKQLFSHYLGWAASKLETAGWLRYNSPVYSVAPTGSNAAKVKSWQIQIGETGGSSVTSIEARRIVVAIEPKAKLPSCLSNVSSNCFVLSAATSKEAVQSTSLDPRKPFRIAILGGNDDAIDLFQDISSSIPNAEVTLYTNESTLRQTDNNP